MACNHIRCKAPDTHLIFGWGTSCEAHTQYADPRTVFRLGLDPVLDRVLLECSLQFANEQIAEEEAMYGLFDDDY